jgi:DNA-binding transcriptional ArsR family regulator
MPRDALAPLFTWRSAVASKDGPHPTTRHVLLTLALYMNEKGASAFPSVETLVEDTGLSKPTVVKHLHLAEEEGWIESAFRGGDVRTGKGWRRKEYRATMPPARHYGFIPVTTEAEEREKELARRAVDNALRSGKLAKRPCLVCGDAAEAHHADYSQRLEVYWLCRLHHKRLHLAETKGAVAVKEVNRDMAVKEDNHEADGGKADSTSWLTSSHLVVKEVNPITPENSPKNSSESVSAHAPEVSGGGDYAHPAVRAYLELTGILSHRLPVFLAEKIRAQVTDDPLRLEAWQGVVAAWAGTHAEGSGVRPYNLANVQGMLKHFTEQAPETVAPSPPTNGAKKTGLPPGLVLEMDAVEAAIRAGREVAEMFDTVPEGERPPGYREVPLYRKHQ